jgi:hypothetical protein
LDFCDSGGDFGLDFRDFGNDLHDFEDYPKDFGELG